MDEVITLTGFHDAIQAAADLGAFDDMFAEPGSLAFEYRRGITALIADLFMRGGDPGDGERARYITRLGIERRRPQ